MNGIPRINRPLTVDEQLKALGLIWGPKRRGYVFLPWISGSATDPAARRKNYRESRAFAWPREKDTAIREHLEAHQTDDLYFAPAMFRGKKRVSEMVMPERALWADLDPVDPKGLGDRAPTVAWESSPGRYQGVWILNAEREGASKPGRENQRLTSELGADPSGWDTTQLLRVPGRPNWKPAYRNADGSPVEGKALWLSGPRYTWSDFDDLPEFGSNNSENVDLLDDELLKSIDRHAVWARVRLKVSVKVREYIGSKTADGADRSDILWQIERDLADAGCSVAEIVAIVRPTVWNKYAGRNDELKRLKIEAAKAVAEAQKGETLESVEDDVKPDDIIWLDDVIAEGVERPKWLIRNIWARGSCGFVSGAPKSYKSWVSLDMAVSIATGTPFLGDPLHPVVGGPKPVLMLLEEDDKRLVVERLQQVVEAKAPGMFWQGQLSVNGNTVVWNPPEGRIPLALHIRKGFTASDEGWQAWLDDIIGRGKFAAVIVDTMGTTAGDIDTDRAAEVMGRILRPLKTLSEKHNCAVAIVHHNKKDDGHNRGGARMLGSVALHAWVENALYVSEREATPRGESVVKVERESKLAPEYKFRIKVPHMRTHTDDTRTLWTPELLPDWGDSKAEGDAEGGASGASEEPTQPKQRGGRRDAGRFLAKRLLGMGAKRGKGLTAEEVAERLAEDVEDVRVQLAQATEKGYLIRDGARFKVAPEFTG